MKSLKHRIVKSLTEQPGQTDAELAESLNESRKAINRTLYLELSAQTKRDDNLLWYALSETERADLLTNLSAETTFNHLNGKMLFGLEATSRSLQMQLNADHPFFRSEYQALDDKGKLVVMSLFETLGLAISHKFDNSALLDELMTEWSSLLNQRLAAEQAN